MLEEEKLDDDVDFRPYCQKVEFYLNEHHLNEHHDNIAIYKLKNNKKLTS